MNDSRTETNQQSSSTDRLVTETDNNLKPFIFMGYAAIGVAVLNILLLYGVAFVCAYGLFYKQLYILK